MNYYDILFYVFSALIVISALVVVFSRNVIYAAFSLLFTFLGVAGLYVLLMADFIAIAQVMVYVGGILVLLIFGVMLTNRITNVELTSGTIQGVPASIIVGVLLGTLVLLVTKASWLMTGTGVESEGTTRDLGELLLTTFLLPFEVIGILLLVAIMGAAMIARKDESTKETV